MSGQLERQPQCGHGGGHQDPHGQVVQFFDVPIMAMGNTKDANPAVPQVVMLALAWPTHTRRNMARVSAQGLMERAANRMLSVLGMLAEAKLGKR